MNKTQISLSDMIYDARFNNGASHLTEAQQDAIFNMVAKGCRSPMKVKLGRRLELPLSLWKDYGIYKRLVQRGSGFEYICGQDWPSEMRTLRECMTTI